MKQTSMSTQKLVLGAILTALVILLQFLGSFIRLGPFSVSLVLIPIVIGAATCGAGIGAWLGLVFGITVLWSGDAAAFLAVTVPGTVATVIVKGVLCGYFAALAYNAALKVFTGLLGKNGRYVAVVISAIVCPVVNTGVFLLGCLLFFMDTVVLWAGSDSVAHYIIFVLVGGNFIFELVTNMVLSPVVSRILNIKNTL
ncbi:MAG: ECF transporter S component [Clostridia bacterium]|nr:ECF transporter S component [Clostridia bacterium]